MMVRLGAGAVLLAGILSAGLAWAFSPDVMPATLGHRLELTHLFSETVSFKNLTGRWEGPGVLILQSGELSFGRMRLLSRLKGRLVFEDRRIEIRDMLADCPHTGEIRIRGSIFLQNGRVTGFDLNLGGEDCRLAVDPVTFIRCGPSLRLFGTPQAPQVSGHIRIYKARVNQDLLPEPGQREIRIVSDRSDKMSMIRGLGLIWLDCVAVDIGVSISRLRIKGRHMDLGLFGELRLYKSPNATPKLLGNLNVRTGTMMLSDREFTVTRGIFSFQERMPPDPDLDIFGRTTINGADILLHVTGTIGQRKLVLDSEPRMDQTDIVAHILFGGPASSLKERRAMEAEKIALTYEGGMAATELNKALGNVFEVDDVEVEVDEEDITEGTLALGKYIVPDVFVTYRQSLKLDDLHQLEITYEFNKNISLQTQLNDERTAGVDLVLEYDF